MHACTLASLYSTEPSGSEGAYCEGEGHRAVKRRNCVGTYRRVIFYQFERSTLGELEINCEVLGRADDHTDMVLSTPSLVISDVRCSVVSFPYFLQIFSLSKRAEIQFIDTC